MQNAIADYLRTDEYAAYLDTVTHVLDRLLLRHQSILKAEGMEQQVKNLRRWAEDSRKDFTMAGTFPETGNAWLSDLCDNLKLAVEERQRLESEGGLPATKEQNEQNEDLLSTIRRIEKILHMNSALS